MPSTTYVINTSGQSIHINLGEGIYEHLKPAQSIVYNDIAHTNVATYENRHIVARVSVPDTTPAPPNPPDPPGPAKIVRLIATPDKPIIRDSVYTIPLTAGVLNNGIPTEADPAKIPTGTSLNPLRTSFTFKELYHTTSNINYSEFMPPDANTLHLADVPLRSIDGVKLASLLSPDLDLKALSYISSTADDQYVQSFTGITADAASFSPVVPKHWAMFAISSNNTTLIPFSSATVDDAMRIKWSLCANEYGPGPEPTSRWCQLNPNGTVAISDNEADAVGFAYLFNASSRIPGNTLTISNAYQEWHLWMQRYAMNGWEPDKPCMITMSPIEMRNTFKNFKSIQLTYDGNNNLTSYTVTGPIRSIIEKSVLDNKVLDKLIANPTESITFPGPEATFTHAEFLTYTSGYGIKPGTLLADAQDAFSKGADAVTLVELGTTMPANPMSAVEVSLKLDVPGYTRKNAIVVLELCTDDYTHAVGNKFGRILGSYPIGQDTPITVNLSTRSYVYAGIVDGESGKWLSVSQRLFIEPNAMTQTLIVPTPK